MTPSIAHVALWALTGLFLLLAGLLCLLSAAGAIPLLFGGFATALTLAGGYVAAHLADRVA